MGAWVVHAAYRQPLKKPLSEGRWIASGGGEHQLEDIPAKVGDVLALKLHILIDEPAGECLDCVLLRGVASLLDADGHATGKRVATRAADDVSAESADGQQRSGGHVWVVTDVSMNHGRLATPCGVPV